MNRERIRRLIATSGWDESDIYDASADLADVFEALEAEEKRSADLEAALKSVASIADDIRLATREALK